MTPARLTVSMMLGVIAFFAVALAALRSASVGWALTAFLLEWVVLLIVVMGIWFTRGPSRSGWVGALILGGGLVMATSSNILLTNPPGTQINTILGEIFEQLHPAAPMAYIPQTLDPEEMYRRQRDLNILNTAHYSHQNRFTMISTSLLVVAFAALGSFAGRVFASRGSSGVSPSIKDGYTEGKEGP